MNKDDDYYKILGVRKGMPMDEIKKAYHGLAKKYHPDRNIGSVQAEKKFSLISRAFSEIEAEAREHPNEFGVNVNYYDVLKVEINASKDEITAAYRARVFECENNTKLTPEGIEERLHTINKAYDLILSLDEEHDPDDW